MYLTTPGLVLRVSPYNDTDAFLTILTGQHGRISAKVRGLRRKNSPLSAACQLLCLSEFTLFEYKGAYTVNEAHSIQLFNGLRKDLQKLSLGTYFAQAAEVLSQEDLPNPELLSLVLNCLYGLSELGTSEAQVKSAFELRSACIAGYTPDLSVCHSCGSQTPDRFDISEGKLECANCRDVFSNGIRMPITPGVLEAMRYICSCDSRRMFSFSLPIDSMDQLSQITESYLSTQLERGFSALDFYKSLVYSGDLST